MTKRRWVLVSVLLVVVAALWHETQYRRVPKPVQNAPVQHANPQADSSTRPQPQGSPSKVPESELLIG